MHAIQFHHGPNWLPAAVTAYSLRKNGGLRSLRLTLYTTDSNVLENPYLPRVFDEICEPPEGWRGVWETDWNQWKRHKSHVGLKAYPVEFRRYTMLKYYSFLAAPCEAGETVLYTDGDVLCLQPVAELENLLNGRPWGARVNYWTAEGKIGHVNAGVLLKTAAFSDVVERFLEPVLNPDVYAEALQLTLLDDEAALKWTLRRYGTLGLVPLHPAFNAFMWNYEHRAPTFAPRFMHFCCRTKPWLGTYYPTTMRGYYQEWERTALETCRFIDYPPSGRGVPDRFRWPYQIGEKRQPLSWRFHPSPTIAHAHP